LEPELENLPLRLFHFVALLLFGVAAFLRDSLAAKFGSTHPQKRENDEDDQCGHHEYTHQDQKAVLRIIRGHSFRLSIKRGKPKPFQIVPGRWAKGHGKELKLLILCSGCRKVSA
jgi:hypothetical protein